MVETLQVGPPHVLPPPSELTHALSSTFWNCVVRRSEIEYALRPLRARCHPDMRLFRWKALRAHFQESVTGLCYPPRLAYHPSRALSTIWPAPAAITPSRYGLSARTPRHVSTLSRKRARGLEARRRVRAHLIKTTEHLLPAPCRTRLIKDPYYGIVMIRKANDISSRAHQVIMCVLGLSCKFRWWPPMLPKGVRSSSFHIQ